ncbi:MAG: septal ring lytic transglycosylase RlpA family protein [Francisellaceae bacterium]|jgi:rare lipoprotein A|nr:septal ring lytic transglycosylase RlpA family protein [Francisellaceae bacterium]MBT6206883.1 septal ring lytic transglycosylase RlpA family protein [Francisellaceae bacterium]MBT6539725.1 septal ring lytic transglycosylase RlpA family protein [Francisellaceae bacterium]
MIIKRFILSLVIVFLSACQTAKVSQREYLGHNHSYKHANDSAPQTDYGRLNNVKDAVPRYEVKSKYGNPRSYSVKNKTYQVLDNNKDFTQHGTASWYGKKFHGFKTSNGETYDMYAMSAAHKTLPLPSYVEVKNIENGRTTIVRVNDRGPFHGDHRIIDLSYAAAHKLGVISKGTAKVEISAIDRRTLQLTNNDVAISPTEQPKVAQQRITAPSYIQVGAFSNIDNAKALAEKVRLITSTQVRIIPHNSIHKVQLGPLPSNTRIQTIQNTLIENNIEPGIITS